MVTPVELHKSLNTKVWQAHTLAWDTIFKSGERASLPTAHGNPVVLTLCPGQASCGLPAWVVMILPMVVLPLLSTAFQSHEHSGAGKGQREAAFCHPLCKLKVDQGRVSETALNPCVVT